jgi:pSer/pThr/pTyr-binding forkhead associated (FHA) protein
MPEVKSQLRVVRFDGGPELVVPFSRDALTLGTQADIKPPDDPFLAPMQARFTQTTGRVSVEDLGSGNGVFIRLKVQVDRDLVPGNELRVGRQRLLIEALPASQPAVWGSKDPGFKARLVQIFEGGRRGDVHPIKDGEVMLGREYGDITFPGDGFVSGRHASFVFKGGRLSVKDLGSSNGTFFRLMQPTVVDVGDQLLVGRHLVKVERAA